MENRSILLVAIAVMFGLSFMKDTHGACNSEQTDLQYIIEIDHDAQEYYIADEAASITFSLSAEAAPPYEGETVSPSQPAVVTWSGIVNGTNDSANFNEEYTIELPADIMTNSLALDDRNLVITVTNAPDNYLDPDDSADDGLCDALADIKLTIIKVDITGFSDDEPYARHGDCPTNNHRTTCQATISPSGISSITYSIQGDAHGATIDPDTGVITPGVNESGEITVRAVASMLPSCFDEEQLAIRPCPTSRHSHTVSWINENAVDPSTGEPSPYRAYGGNFRHIFTSSGGELTGESISEEIRIQTGENDFNLDFEADPGESVWTLDSAGKMTTDDTYMFTFIWFCLDLFWPNSLSAHSVFEQKYFWRCPDCTDAEGADAWRQITGPDEIEWELREGSPIDPAEVRMRFQAYGEVKVMNYVGYVFLENLEMTPDTIVANSTDTSQGSVDIVPSYRNVVWSITGNALGCTINATGQVTAGSDDGAISVEADGEPAYSDGLFPCTTSLTLTAP